MRTTLGRVDDLTRSEVAGLTRSLTYLLSTGENVLVEASPYDRVWGIGLKQEDKRAADPIQWQGSNLLGFALMDVREQLKAGSRSVRLRSARNFR